MKLVQHTYSGLFSSFLFNSIEESIKAGCTQTDKTTESNGISVSLPETKLRNDDSTAKDPLRAYSIWDYLGKHNYEFINPAYNAKHAHQKTMLVFPKLLSEFELWRDVYCCTTVQNCINNPESVQLPQQIASNSAMNNVTSNGNTTHDVLEKTLSRSQSASSLTSLEPNTNAIQPIHITPNGTATTHNNGTPTAHNTTVGSIGSTTSIISNCCYMPRVGSGTSDPINFSNWHVRFF